MSGELAERFSSPAMRKESRATMQVNISFLPAYGAAFILMFAS